MARKKYNTLKLEKKYKAFIPGASPVNYPEINFDSIIKNRSESILEANPTSLKKISGAIYSVKKMNTLYEISKEFIDFQNMAFDSLLEIIIVTEQEKRFLAKDQMRNFFILKDIDVFLCVQARNKDKGAIFYVGEIFKDLLGGPKEPNLKIFTKEEFAL